MAQPRIWPFRSAEQAGELSSRVVDIGRVMCFHRELLVTRVLQMLQAERSGPRHVRYCSIEEVDVNSKPRILVVSSSESLHVARAIQENLHRDAHTTVWDQGIFDPPGTVLERLLEAAGKCDLAVCVLTPDDVLQMRETQNRSVRDNVLFELGLFIGKLGKDRTLMVVPEGQNDMQLPSDLQGLIAAHCDPDWDDHVPALGAASNKIRRCMERLARDGDATVVSITFAYEDSPTDHGWELSECDDGTQPSFTHLAGPNGERGVQIQSKGPYAMDYGLPAHRQRGSLVRFVARYENRHAVVYVHILVQEMEGTAPREVDLACHEGVGPPRPRKDGTREWAVPLKGVPLDDEWKAFEIDLSNTVNCTFGTHGWAFDKPLGFRLRGDLSVARIEVIGRDV